MKILFISDLYPIIEDDTIPSIVYDFTRAFLELNHEISVIRPNFIINSIIRHRKILKNQTIKKDGIIIYNRNFFLPILKENIDFLDKDFDLIISHMPLGHIYADLINKKLKLPRLSVIHQSDYHVLNEFKYSFYFKNRLKKAIKNSTLIAARNKFLFNKLNADFLLPSFIEKKYILNSKKIENTKKLKIITLSKLIKRKNIHLVINALKNAEFDFEYTIYGSGTEKNNLNKLIKKYNLNSKIKIIDKIPHREIFSKLDENDIFILPSKNETFGLSYLEALSRGLIVIGSKNCGFDELINSELNGYIIEPNEKNILNTLNKISKLTIEQKKIISENALNLAHEFEKEKIMTKYIEKIKKI